jgi:hypothetical protein
MLNFFRSVRSDICVRKVLAWNSSYQKLILQLMRKKNVYEIQLNFFLLVLTTQTENHGTKKNLKHKNQ